MGKNQKWVNMSHGQKLRYDRENLGVIADTIDSLTTNQETIIDVLANTVRRIDKLERKMNDVKDASQY